MLEIVGLTGETALAMKHTDESRESRDRRRFVKRLAVGVGLSIPAVVTLMNRKVAAQSGPTPTATEPPA